MKRSYSEMSSTLSVLSLTNADSKWYRATLEGTHRLCITKVVDISKPTDKPIEDIDEPEEEDLAMQSKLGKNNARMIQLDLKDLNDTVIKAVETEFIEKLNEVKPGCVLIVQGPIDIRCGNIMLERKHVICIESKPKNEEEQAQVVKEPREEVQIEQQPLESQSVQQPKEEVQVTLKPKEEVQVLHVVKPDVINLEDWDEDEEDDCIILD